MPSVPVALQSFTAWFGMEQRGSPALNTRPNQHSSAVCSQDISIKLFRASVKPTNALLQIRMRSRQVESSVFWGQAFFTSHSKSSAFFRLLRLGFAPKAGPWRVRLRLPTSRPTNEACICVELDHCCWVRFRAIARNLTQLFPRFSLSRIEKHPSPAMRELVRARGPGGEGR